MLLRYLAIGGVMIILISTALTYLARPDRESALVMAFRNEMPTADHSESANGSPAAVVDPAAAAAADPGARSAGDRAFVVMRSQSDPDSVFPPPVEAIDAERAAIEPGLGATLVPAPPSMPPARQPATRAAEVPTAPTTELQAAGAPFRVQLVSMRSQSEAEQAWQTLRQRHADVLGSLDGNVVPADLGGRGIYYRLRAGPFADRDRANGVCQALSRQHVDCIVVSGPG